jgi:hypothetical protein
MLVAHEVLYILVPAALYPKSKYLRVYKLVRGALYPCIRTRSELEASARCVLRPHASVSEGLMLVCVRADASVCQVLY